MVENGNKTKGLILTILLALLMVITVLQVIRMSTTHQVSTKGYQDPEVSTTHVRGTIYDRNGNVLAIQAPEYGFQISSAENPQHLASVLTPYTNYSSVEIVSLLQEGTTFIPVKGIPTSADIEYYVKYLEMNGLSDVVSFTLQEKRKYPVNGMEDLLGYAYSPYQAKGGIEELFNAELSAAPTLNAKSVYGKTLVLTIDLELQNAVEDTFLHQADDSTVILFSSNKQILAAYGNIDEECLRSMVYSISTSTETVLNDITIEEEQWNASRPIGQYFVYLEGKNKETMFNSLQTILTLEGKI